MSTDDRLDALANQVIALVQVVREVHETTEALALEILGLNARLGVLEHDGGSSEVVSVPKTWKACDTCRNNIGGHPDHMAALCRVRHDRDSICATLHREWWQAYDKGAATRDCPEYEPKGGSDG